MAVKTHTKQEITKDVLIAYAKKYNLTHILKELENDDELPIVDGYQATVKYVPVTYAKTGVKYVEKRVTVYVREKQYVETLSSKRIGKIMPGSTEIVPCRPKRTKEEMAPIQTAKREYIGANLVLDMVAQHSIFDKAVQEAYPLASYLKLQSIAQYLVATNGTINNIEDYQVNHKLPYQHNLSPQTCYKLLEDIGLDEGRMQSVFQDVASQVSDSPILALDSTTMSCYGNLSAARFGFNKDSNGLKTIKLITLYAVNQRIPISFELQAGDIPDVKSLENSIKRAHSHGLKTPEFVLDNGFMTKLNLLKMVNSGIKFTGMANLSHSWVQKALLNEYDVYDSALTALECMHPLSQSMLSVTGVQVKTEVEFNEFDDAEIAVYEDVKDIKKKITLNLNFYRDNVKANSEFQLYMANIYDIVTEINKNPAYYDELSNSDKKELHECYQVTKEENGNIILKQKSLAKIKEQMGIFCIVSTENRTPLDTLVTYRLRNRIEEGYNVEKNQLDGKVPRVHSMIKLRGKEFCRLYALNYQTSLQVAINNIIEKCNKLSDDPKVSKTEQKRYSKLKSWLKAKSLRSVITWFNNIERVTVLTSDGVYEIESEIIQRDRLFLNMLEEELANPTLSSEINEVNIPWQLPEPE